jgi:hypothetical protein
MTPYIRNRNCQCVRCRAHGLMAPAVLITLGVLFLLDNNGVVSFHETFPVLFLVIGGVLLISRTGSTEGHVQPGWTQAPAATPPQPFAAGATPPPPSTENPPSSGNNDSQVNP